MTFVVPVTAADPLLAELSRRFPELFALVDPARCAAPSTAVPVDFEDSAVGGRGETYRDAQRDPSIRARGIATLFDLASPDGDRRSWQPGQVVLDVLGGDGTLARAAATGLPSGPVRPDDPHSPLDAGQPAGAGPTVLTSDLSAGMVAAAQRHGLPALQQPAQRLRLRDSSVDAVIIAYGTHHIPVEQRLDAVREAWRVLRPGGRLVLHDFAEDSPVARWFTEVVHPYSRTGHPYPHFTAEAMTRLFNAAGFADVRVVDVYDPFVLIAVDQSTARLRLGRHLADMYGLVRLAEHPNPAPLQTRADPAPPAEHPDPARPGVALLSAELAEKIFRYPPGAQAPGQTTEACRYTRVGAGWRVERPRVALVSVGRKPHRKSGPDQR